MKAEVRTDIICAALMVGVLIVATALATADMPGMKAF
jgi:hypothetical protein